MVKIGDTVGLTKAGARRVLNGQEGSLWRVGAVHHMARNADLSTRLLESRVTLAVQADGSPIGPHDIWSLGEGDWFMIEEAAQVTPDRVVVSVTHTLVCEYCVEAVITAGAHMGIASNHGQFVGQATIDRRGVGGVEHTGSVMGGGFAPTWVAGFELPERNGRLVLDITEGARS